MDIKSIGVRDLKNNLSAYLREVRRGVRILVTDRSRVIAELHEPGAAYDPTPSENPVLAQWARDGLLTATSHPKAPLPDSPVSLANGTSDRLLGDDRSDSSL